MARQSAAAATLSPTSIERVTVIDAQGGTRVVHEARGKGTGARKRHEVAAGRSGRHREAQELEDRDAGSGQDAEGQRGRDGAGQHGLVGGASLGSRLGATEEQ